MRIISLHQPWALLVAMNLKRFETRSWATPYRGKLAIHAAKRSVDSDGFLLIRKAFELDGRDFQQEQGWVEGLQFGCILAIADLTDCLLMESHPKIGAYYVEQNITLHAQGKPNAIIIETASDLERAVGDWRPGRYAWKLENIRPIANPIYYRGRQGLTIIREPMVVQQIEEQLALTDRIEQQLQAIKEAV
ncbi:MAG: ASCH domain-containing protein [Drouetiella hepatica Uher 2000/2452]|uniref:ASCH domain-containing protein n=1 Tax=Drouetiella hepatica Uher 2000/2452 TaxID=904376 RepID=A0A951QD24_9CYAN|nr:ASCH domain-containing protein [Drouetiella hepatica Uher 2000/2452]